MEEELKAAYMYLCTAQAQCRRWDFSTGREHKIVSDELELLTARVSHLIETVERFQR